MTLLVGDVGLRSGRGELVTVLDCNRGTSLAGGSCSRAIASELMVGASSIVALESVCTLGCGANATAKGVNDKALDAF